MHAQATNSGYSQPSIPAAATRANAQKGVVKAGRQPMYHGLHGCGCSLLVMVVLAQHLGLLLGTQPLQRQVRRRLSQLPSQQHMLHQACQHIRISHNALIAVNEQTNTHNNTNTHTCAASTESAEVNHQELYRSWHSQNHHCSCPCSI